MQKEKCCDNPRIIQHLSGHEYTEYGERTDNFVEIVECINCGHVFYSEAEEKDTQLKTIPY